MAIVAISVAIGMCIYLFYVFGISVYEMMKDDFKN